MCPSRSQAARCRRLSYFRRREQPGARPVFRDDLRQTELAFGRELSCSFVSYSITAELRLECLSCFHAWMLDFPTREKLFVLNFALTRQLTFPLRAGRDRFAAIQLQLANVLGHLRREVAVQAAFVGGSGTNLRR